MHLLIKFQSRQKRSLSYPVEYNLVLVEEYSKGKIHKSEPDPGNGNVNTVYFVHQARGKFSSSFSINKHTIAKCLLMLELPA